MSMDPSKWVGFQDLTGETQTRVETTYPYLKTDLCQFQEKNSGVFMRQGNGVKIEKLLDPTNAVKPRVGSGGGTTRVKKGGRK